ncbi:MAG: N-succinylarginine dihydrolase [Verrucomicrobia bacterium]|nr:N-succinylarginine dihydrolase [Verrucomicrobiota bacterium]MBS0636823.1 N-succinylarginine dihydrolase [Verrucomicrobiota bacterium]
MIEAQVDTIVGPTHYYGGLSYGNVASMGSRMQQSNPQLAALQGLNKMKLVHDLGVPQLILPPQMRPDVEMIEELGFHSVEEAYKKAPQLLVQCSSQSAMWTANAATVTPSEDSADGKVHFTPANLVTNFHRSLETARTADVLKQVFSSKRYFVHHDPLPAAQDFADEGAANHTRLNGVHLFVYGKGQTKIYPARQSLLAQEAIKRRHGISKVVFAEQNPKVIDQGVFHNDVIAVGHEDLFFFHEDAYVHTQEVLSKLLKYAPLNLVAVRKKELTVEEAVKSYIFNSQFLTLPDGQHVVICPTEVEKMPRAKAIVETRLPVDRVYYLALNQSMKNGGGPACLRLRVPLTKAELKAVKPSVIFTEGLYRKLKKIIIENYPDSFSPRDLTDTSFRKNCTQAVDKITKALGLV